MIFTLRFCFHFFSTLIHNPLCLGQNQHSIFQSPLIRSTLASQHRRPFTTMSYKPSKFSHLPLSTSGTQDCALSGSALLNAPCFNKGSAFPTSEREEFKLTGLLPQNVQTLEQQVKRAYEQYTSGKDDLAKNTFMTSMKEQNEVLFYRVRKLLTSVPFSSASDLACAHSQTLPFLSYL
jgi:hypothetical protein